MSDLSDEEILKANAHISDEQVRQDIADTKKEIDKLQSARALNYAMGYVSRLSIGYEGAIQERPEFIWDLEYLLELREKAVKVTVGENQ